jgi:hypothetical protein
MVLTRDTRPQDDLGRLLDAQARLKRAERNHALLRDRPYAAKTVPLKRTPFSMRLRWWVSSIVHPWHGEEA